MSDRHRRPVLAALFAIAVILPAAIVPPTTEAATWYPGKLAAPRILAGLDSPTAVTNAGDGTGRLFIVQQAGTIRIVQNGALKPGYFLDIRGKVAAGGERGLLGLAFHPNFESNRRLFIYYTRNGGDLVISRLTTNASRTDADEGSEQVLQVIEHSANTNHNGGALAFGPSNNNYLYIGVGDGGGAGDPRNNGQSKSTLLGKILRVNVNGSNAGPFDHYSIPGSNPFAGSRPGRGEIWAYGLRNPWRISFARGTGKLFIADVGQGRREEVNREKAGISGGRNYGWDAMEGSLCYTASKCPLSGDTLPNAEYGHSGGNCSITGGYVYRGPTQTALVGLYVFADWCSGRIWTIPHNGTAVNTPETLRADTGHQITSFGESENGELYVVTSAGNVLQVMAS